MRRLLLPALLAVRTCDAQPAFVCDAYYKTFSANGGCTDMSTTVVDESNMATSKCTTPGFCPFEKTGTNRAGIIAACDFAAELHANSKS